MTDRSARSHRAESVPTPIASSSRRASAGESTGVAPFVTTCFGPRTAAAAGVHREDVAADDEPVAEHADRGQVLQSAPTHDLGAHTAGAPRGRTAAAPEW